MLVPINTSQMTDSENLMKEIRDLEIYFTERLDDGADSKELASILSRIKLIKKQLLQFSCVC